VNDIKGHVREFAMAAPRTDVQPCSINWREPADTNDFDLSKGRDWVGWPYKVGSTATVLGYETFAGTRVETYDIGTHVADDDLVFAYVKIESETDTGLKGDFDPGPP
jgi:hypothetical protein